MWIAVIIAYILSIASFAAAAVGIGLPKVRLEWLGFALFVLAYSMPVIAAHN